MPEVQVLISAYGPEALERIASLRHDPFPGVEYVVGWQKYDKSKIPATLDARKDFKIVFLESTGLCNNRNALLREAGADVCVISDDDLEYTESHLKNISEAFKANPGFHFLTFRYGSDNYPKNYPDKEFSLKRPPKGYFVTSMELAFNLRKIREEKGELELLLFNNAFGVNGRVFMSGEEDLLVARLLKNGLEGKYIPVEICRNTDSTTSERAGNTEAFIQTKGAVISHIKPFTWPLRLVAHAMRSGEIPPLRYCRWWLAGVRKAQRCRVFENY